MKKNRLYIIPSVFIIISAILVWSTAIIAPDALGNLKWVLFAAGASALIGIFWAGISRFRYEQGEAGTGLEKEKQALRLEKQAFKEETENFKQVKKSFEQEIEKRTVLIGKRENILSQKLITLHEWMEFPKNIEESVDIENNLNSTDFGKQDQAVMELLKEQTDLIFERIKNNYYKESGIFQKDRLFDDIFAIIDSIARIYHPDSENPVLETSMEQLLRAVNRAALHILVLMEQLPLDFKTYNLKKTFETVQTGVKAYDVYQKAMPYWTWLRPVYYLGRFSLGASPITLGVGWALGELAKTGAQKISSRLADQYAINLIYDIIFIIGNESASIFGEDFRHREPNWIYGTELTEMICNFPLSREIMQGGLNEIGQLTLRNEYDRIFLYRCIAAKKSAGPGNYKPDLFISFEERRAVAKKLEKFWIRYIADTKNCAVPESWKIGFEDRMGVKLCINTDILSISFQEKSADCLFSLTGYLMSIKRIQPAELPVLLSETRVLTYLDHDLRRETVEKLMDAPPMIFDYPDIEQTDPLLDDYISDLIYLCVSVFPSDASHKKAVYDVCRYFRCKKKEIQKQIDKMYSSFIADKLLPQSPEKKIKPYISFSISTFLKQEEIPLFIYMDIAIEMSKNQGQEIPGLKSMELCLLATNNRVMVIAVPGKNKDEKVSGILTWQAVKSSSGAYGFYTEQVKGRIIDDCRISGGKWALEELNNISPAPLIRLSGHAVTRYEKYFKPLIEFSDK